MSGISLACCYLPQSLSILQQQSGNNSQQRGPEPSEAAQKLRSMRSEEIRSRKPSTNSPRSKLQDIAEKATQSSSAESVAGSQASSAR